MPGIVGIISQASASENTLKLGRMLESMKYEDFYASGSYSDPSLGLHVGWTSHRGAPDDCLPIRNEHADAALFLSGAVYAEPADVRALRSKGHDIAGPGLSYLIHLYEEDGARFFSSLNGWFAGVLVDSRRGRCFVFNDRYGMGRLFVHEAPDAIYFASEAKALLAVLPDTRRFDPAGLAQFLTCGCTLGTTSLFKDIAVLPGGSLWEADRAGVRKGSYFSRGEWESQESLAPAAFERRLTETFPAVVARYAGSELPTGVSLTGGLDSRMLMACLDPPGGQMPCYTFGSMYRDTLDVTVARQVAEKCRQPHTVLVLGDDFLERFPQFLDDAVYRSDGYLGLSGAAELYLNAQARGIAPVRLTGNWGGELLRGVRAFKATRPPRDLVLPDLSAELEGARQQFERDAAGNGISFALFHQAPDQGYGRLSIEESQVIVRTPFMDNELAQLVYRQPRPFPRAAALSRSIVARHRPDLAAIPTDRGELGDASWPVRTVRNAYLELLAKGEYWSNHGWPGPLARLSRFAPSGSRGFFLGRHKFQHFGLWMRNQLSQHVQDIVQSRARRSCYVNARGLEEAVRAHQQGRGNGIDDIDRALTIVSAEAVLLGGGRQ